MRARSASGRDGQIVVVFAMALLTIALMVGLVVDGGMVFLQRRDGQNEADLAALAGTKVIADAWIDPARASTPRSAVYSTIRDRLAALGCTATGGVPCTWTAHLVGPKQSDLGLLTAGSTGTVTGSNPKIMGVRVDVTRRPQTIFLGVLGQTSWQVVTSATALAAQPPSAPQNQLLPIALRSPEYPFTKGQVYDLTPDRVAPGGFVWIDWPSGGTSVAASTCVPDNPVLDLGGAGTVVRRGTPDTDWKRVRGCLVAWRDAEATVLIPIYDADSKSTPPKYNVVQVAAFVIRDVGAPKPGGDPSIFDLQAAFVGTFAYPSAPADAVSPPTPDDSLYYLGLVK